MNHNEVLKSIKSVRHLNMLENYLLEYMPDMYCPIMRAMATGKTILIDGKPGPQGKSTLINLIRNTGYKGYVQDICEFENYKVITLDKHFSHDDMVSFRKKYPEIADKTPDIKKIKALWKKYHEPWDVPGLKNIERAREDIEEVVDLPYTQEGKDSDLNCKITELMKDYSALVTKAKEYGLDIRLYSDSPTLELYYNDDYPDTLLVDKSVGR